MTAIEPQRHALLDPGRAWRLNWIAVLVGGVAAYLLVLRMLVDTNNLNFVPSLLLLGSAVVPCTVLVFTATDGRRVAVDPGLLALVAVLGGVIGTVAAGSLEYDTLSRLGVLPMVVVGLIEETAKLITPLAVVLLARRYRNAAAGVMVGVASGMGFATLETAAGVPVPSSPTPPARRTASPRRLQQDSAGETARPAVNKSSFRKPHRKASPWFTPPSDTSAR